MRRLITARFYRSHSRFMVVPAVVAGVLLTGSLSYRATVTNEAASTVCAKVHTLDVALEVVVEAAQPTRAQLLELTYYREHPGEVAIVLRQAEIAERRQLRLLRRADCTTAR